MYYSVIMEPEKPPSLRQLQLLLEDTSKASRIRGLGVFFRMISDGALLSWQEHPIRLNIIPRKLSLISYMFLDTR